MVYLGDFIDRGPGVCETLALLVENPLRGFKAVYLKGNHEDLLEKFLINHAVGRNWLDNGGAATLRSYGVRRVGDDDPPDDGELQRLQADFCAALPPAHRDFLAGLKLWHIEGDYYFVHAGVSPRRPLDGQFPEDVLWIRNEFLSSRDSFGKVVVHGHSVASTPQIFPNRIGIDTGAYATGRLTCLVLQENTYSFFSDIKFL